MPTDAFLGKIGISQKGHLFQRVGTTPEQTAPAQAAKLDTEALTSSEVFDQLFPPKPPIDRAEPAARESTTFVAPGTPASPGRVEPITPWWINFAEPRPDLKDDSGLWLAVLRVAFVVDGHQEGGTVHLLHAIRCEGGHLKPRPDRLYLDRGNERPKLIGVALRPEQIAEREIDAETWTATYLPQLSANREKIVEILTKAKGA